MLRAVSQDFEATWLSVSASQIAYGAARLMTGFGAKLDHDRARTIAHSLFKLIEAHLENQQFLVESPTIADIANYAYVAHAQGEVSLQPYSQI